MRAARNIFAAATLMLAALAPAAAQSGEAAALAEFQAAVEELRETTMRPGEFVEGWDRGGANPDADLRAMGADRYYFQTRGRDGTSVAILTDRPIADFAPAGWRVVDSYGASATRLPSPQVDFAALSPRYVLGSRTQFRRVNDVDCYDGFTDALLFEVPDAAAGPDDDIIPMLFRMMILAMEGQTVCVRSDGDAERGYSGREFLPDGRALPEFADPDLISVIVPAAPVDRLIAPPPPRSEDPA